MKELSTDICRDKFDYPDDKNATIERIVMFFSCLAMGIVFGVILTLGYFSVRGQQCSAHPYCSIHVKK